MVLTTVATNTSYFETVAAPVARNNTDNLVTSE